MPRKSIIKGLPASFRRDLDRLILEEKLSIDGLREFITSFANRGGGQSPPWSAARSVAALCDNAAITVPSRSAVGDYAKQVRDEAKETALYLRESREMASAIAQELGPESVEGEQGRLLIEMLRTFLFRFIRDRRKDPDAAFEPGEFAKMARALRDLSQAMQFEQDFAKRIRDEERKKVEAEVKARVGKLGSAEELKTLSNEELERKISELAAGTI